MNATEIITAIQELPVTEQLKVIQFAYRLDAERQLTGQELSALAEKMVTAHDPVEKAMLRDAVFRGFYGQKLNA